jgi:hypothetical protein
VLKTKIPPAKTQALIGILRSSPFIVYAYRGMLGYSKPRYSFANAPPGFDGRAFHWLKKNELIRRIGSDDLKELWDISDLGVDALCRADEAVARIDPRMIQRRLTAPFDVYEFDSIGLIGAPARTLGKVQGSEPPILSVIGLAESRKSADEGSAVPQAQAVFDAKYRDLFTHGEILGFARVINAIVDVLEHYLKDCTGAVEIKLQRIQFSEDTCVDVNYWDSSVKLKSFDASVPEGFSIGSLLKGFCGQPGSETPGWTATVDLCVSRTKTGEIRSDKVPEDFEPHRLVASIHAAVSEIRPEQLRHTHRLSLVFRKYCELQWDEIGGPLGYPRNWGRAIWGKGGKKICDAMKALGSQHCGITGGRHGVKKVVISVNVEVTE